MLVGWLLDHTRTVGKTAAENPPSVESRGHSISHLTMFNLCTAFGKWEEAAHVRKKMAKKNLKKELSCSWNTIKGSTHRYIVGDRHHLQTAFQTEEDLAM